MFYSRLTSLCAERGVKVTNVVSELKMGSGNLSSWKSGRMPRGDTLSKLADYFHVSTDYLLGRTDDPRPVSELGGPAPVSESRPAQPPEYEFLTSVNKAIADRLIADLVKSQPSNVTPIKISAIAQGGQESETEADTVITLPRSSSRVRSAPETAETDGTPSAPEEK